MAVTKGQLGRLPMLSVLILLLFAPVCAHAITEGFRTGTPSNAWTFNGNTCLTVAGGTTPCPGSAANYNDQSGFGWLRFTTAGNNQSGNAILQTNLALSQGVSVSFTYAIYSGNGADGLSIFFIDPTVSNAGTGASLGGGLGYCGIVGGVVGIGIDVYGNFTAAGSSVGSSCSGNASSNPSGHSPGSQQSNISVRSGANATIPYDYLAGTGKIAQSTLRTDSSWTAPPAPTSPATTYTCSSTSGCARTGAQMQVSFYPDASCGSGQYRLIVTSSAVTGQVANICVSTSTLGTIPGNVEIGFAASTGGLNEYHEIRDVTIQQIADVAVAKTDGVTTVNSGATTTYTLTASNIGPGGADGSVLTDPVVPGLSKTSVTCTVPSGSTAVCPTAPISVASLEGGLAIPKLPAGSSLQFNVAATVTATSGTVTNTATIALPPNNTLLVDPNTANNTASDTDTINVPLTLIKTIAGRASTSDDFTISVTPSTPAATASTNGSSAAQTYLPLSQLVSGSTYTMSETAQAQSGTNLSNYTTTYSCANANTTSTTTLPSGTATGTTTRSFTIKPKTGDAIICTLTNTPTGRRLLVTKTANPNPFTVNQAAQYSIIVQNVGGTATTGSLTIADTLPSGITLTGFSGANWSCSSVGTSSAACTFSSTLSSGASTTLTLNVAVTASATTGNNSATVTGGGTGSNCATGNTDPNCTGSVTVPVIGVVNVAITKTDNVGGIYTPGGTAVYTITITNGGPSAANNLAVGDALPKGVSTTGAWTCGGGTGGATCSAASGGQASIAGDGATNLFAPPTPNVSAALTASLPAPVSPATTTSVTIQIPVKFSANVGDY